MQAEIKGLRQVSAIIGSWPKVKHGPAQREKSVCGVEVQHQQRKATRVILARAAALPLFPPPLLYRSIESCLRLPGMPKSSVQADILTRVWCVCVSEEALFAKEKTKRLLLFFGISGIKKVNKEGHREMPHMPDKKGEKRQHATVRKKPSAWQLRNGPLHSCALVLSSEGIQRARNRDDDGSVCAAAERYARG